ncbi:hypothetical protein BD770DRAFT_297375, partial [Pilaira anomala]
ELTNASLDISHFNHLGSDHAPVTLSFSLTSPPPLSVDHPRLLWHLSNLMAQKYAATFTEKVRPLKSKLANHVKALAETIDTTNISPPPIEDLAAELTGIIHSSLDKTVGRKKPKESGNAFFWTPVLQDLIDKRDKSYRLWKQASEGVGKGIKYKNYTAAKFLYKTELTRRRRETYALFLAKLSNGSFTDTTATIKRIKRTRTISPGFTHPAGPTAAAVEMSRHLRTVYAG